MPHLSIDVFADIACPWCYIGERRLYAALAQRPKIEAHVRWRPFQLQPALPAEGVPWREFAEQKFGGWERARAGFQRVAEAGAQVGIAFDFESLPRAVNTTDAHRVILMAREHGLEWEIAAALFRAYFEEGRDVGDRATLVAIADAVDPRLADAAAYLDSDAGHHAVVQSQRFAQQHGVSGVPFSVFDGRLALSGAQPVGVFIDALDHALEAA